MTHYLPIGHTIQDHDHSCEYTIKSVLGRGASTITYLADYSDGTGYTSERILKEYYPISMDITRASFGELIYAGSVTEKFIEGLARYNSGGALQNDLRKRACLKNETPPLQRIFNVNNTCYLDVVPFEGRTFDKFETFTLHERLEICLAVAKLINQYHKEGYLYLDLKPENIFVLTNSAGEVVTDMVVLIDFDSVIKRDQVAFGKSLSFTKLWAAPEQINPHGFRKISEATDIYAVGELVFWSVFNRHSTEEEHRGFSSYLFDDTIRYVAQRKLSDLFHSTLRSSPRNRLHTMEPVIDILSELCEILSQKEYIITSEVRPNEFFVGRNNECGELSARLEAERLIFLCGIGGIGKSEIAKQHATKNKQKYNNILYFSYTGDFEDTICQDYVSIATIERVEDESDHHFCWRKLHAIKRCLRGNNLIIIDNLNSRLDEIEHQSVWEFLRSLPCEIIVTTRAKQTDHMFRVEELVDINSLRAIYRHNCPYSADQEPFADEIIQRLNRHTLLTELIAKQTCAAMCTPKEMLKRLQANGLHSLDKETIGIQKDDRLSRGTTYHHLDTLFTMSSMTFDQQLTITKAAFMPETGIVASDFLAYHAIENNNIINWLVDNGWLYCSKDDNFTLSIHPVIAEIVIEKLKENSDLLHAFYSHATISLPWKSQAISHRVHDQLCKSIASITMRSFIDARPAAVYLIRHVEHPAVRSRHASNLSQIKYAISVIEGEKSATQYSALLEYAHLCRIRAGAEPNTIDTSIAECKKHLKCTKEARDFYLTAKFGHLLSRLYWEKASLKNGRLSDILRYIYYYFVSISYWVNLEKDLKRKVPRHSSKERLQNDLDYDYLIDYLASTNTTFYLEIARDLESSNSEILFCSKPPFMETQNLRKAICYRQYFVRDRALNTSFNSIEIVIDKARILYHQEDYEGARTMLLPIVEMYNTKGLLPDGSLYRVHQFLGNLAAVKGDYANAVIELRRCLEIGEELQFSRGFLAEVQLGRFLNEVGDIVGSERVNAKLLSVLEQLDVDTRKSYYGDALYNYATLQFLKGDPNGAIKTYKEAIDEYLHCTGATEFSVVGRARCYRKLYEIYSKYGKTEVAQKRFDQAKDCYMDSLGERHPEVQEFLHLSTK